MRKIMSKEEWIRRKRRSNMIMAFLALLLFIIIIIFSIHFANKIINDNKLKGSKGKVNTKEAITEVLSNGTLINVDYLTPNPYSRPQTSLKEINGLVIHYTANPGTSAKANRSYFEGLAKKKTTYASSHYIIGLQGEIIQCVPLTEVAYTSNDRNKDTISIECCHPDETGEFNDKTYASLVSLAASLCLEFDLEEEDIIRHYDVNEKHCPLFYVENEDSWEQLRTDIVNKVKELKGDL